MNINKPSKVALISGLIVSITGFSEFFFKEDIYDRTKDFIDGVHSSMNPSSELVGLESRKLAPYTPYRYLVDNADSYTNDPFMIKSFVRELGENRLESELDVCSGDECGDGPPIAHAPFFLESYSLDQLTMIGSLDSPVRGKVALVQTPDAGVVQTTQGEYIGRDHGLILSINPEGIIVREKYRSPQGWQDRMATLPLIRN